MKAVLIVLLIVLSIFGGRLVQIQGLDASTLVAEAMQVRGATVPLLAKRGDVTDANGAVLATTVDRRNILVDQTLVGGYQRRQDGELVTVGVQGAAEDLAPMLGLSVDAVRVKLTGKQRGFTLATEVNPEIARRILRLAIPGLATEQASRRVYPGNELAANLLGFVSADNTAYGGVEGAFDSVLSGESGSISYEQAKDGTRIPTGVINEVEPQNGGSVRLTIDRDLQWTAQRLIADKVRESQAESGSVVVLDPHTGAVLAMATAPTFDPNHPAKSDASDRGDRALLDVFEPGSTSKVITMAAALEEGVTDPLAHVTVPNRLKRSDRSFRDSHDHETEYLTAAGVLAQSSNIGTILLGEKVSPPTMERYLRDFGFGSTSGIGLPESPGLLAKADDWSGSQRYTVLFGQGLSVNSLQAAQVFATVANDGVRMPAKVVDGYTDNSGSFHAAKSTEPVRVISEDTARTLRTMMEAVVVEGGTAVKANVPGYRVAGKTGTANRVVDGKYDGYTASFIGMAPADEPELVVAVVVQSPKKGYYGGEIAAPVFRDVMTYALAQRAVPPSSQKATLFPNTWQ